MKKSSQILSISIAEHLATNMYVILDKKDKEIWGNVLRYNQH